MSIIGLHESRTILGLPEFLIRDFASFEFNGLKLKTAPNTDKSAYNFLLEDVLFFQKHLEAPWPGLNRIQPPEFVQRYLTFEAAGKCALCQEDKRNYEFAHIQGWACSRNNSPHNLLRLCLDCHRTHGNDVKLLKGIKEELLRRIHLIDVTNPIYECNDEVEIGHAVYIKEGVVYLAVANSRRNLATGIIQTKFGNCRCIVQRVGLIVCLSGLVPGEEYLLSTVQPGQIVTREEFDQTRDTSQKAILQIIGRAESGKHLIMGALGTDLGLKPNTRVAGGL